MVERLDSLPIGVRWLLAALVLLLVIVILVVVVVRIQAMEGLGTPGSWLSGLFGQSAGQPCLRDASGLSQTNICSNSDDMRLTMLELLEGPEICIPGETIEVMIGASVAAGAKQRYDVGFYLAQDGGNAIDTGGSCFRDYLHPVSSTNDDLDPSGGSGPYFNGELDRPADTCADIQQDAEAYYYLNENQMITIKCADSDGNGIADVGAVITWDNNDQADCSDETDTVPDQISKCSAGSIDISGLLVPMSAHIEVVKDLTPDTDSGLFDLYIDETAWAEGVGEMGSTGPVTVTAGTNVEPGDTHQVSETAGADTALPDYDISLSCVYRDTTEPAGNGTGPGLHDVPVMPGDDIVCTFANVLKTGSILFEKRVLGGTAQPGEWSFTVDGQTAAHGQSLDLYIGEYSVTEDGGAENNAAYTLTGAGGACAPVDSGIALTVPPLGGTCTVTNTRLTGSLDVIKSVGDESQWTLSYTGPISDSADLGNDGHLGPDIVPTGTYSVTENAATGTDGTLYGSSGACAGATENGSSSADGRTVSGVVVGENDAVVCTFTNTRLTGTLEISKTVADESQWTLSYSGPDSNSGDVGNGGTIGPDTVRTGTYTVAEAPAAGTDGTLYSSAGACTGATDNGVLSEDGRTISGVIVGENDAVVCSFTNTRKTGTLTLTKTVADQSLWTLSYSGTDSNSGDVGNGGTIGPDIVRTGAFTVSESPAGTTDGSLYASTGTCSGATDNGTLGPDGRSITGVVIDENDEVVCTFTNIRRPGGIVILKQTDPPGIAGEFAFDSSTAPTSFSLAHGATQTFAELAPDTTYSFDETAPEGWELKQITCSGQVSSGVEYRTTGVSILLAPNEDIICTFVNEAIPGIAVVKTADPVSLMEPGGTVSYTVAVSNTSIPDVALELTALEDTPYGDLTDAENPAIFNSSCELEQVIQPTGAYSCTFQAEASGSPGDVIDDTVTARAQTAAGREAEAGDPASVSITQAPPIQIRVSKVADPEVVYAPSGDVTYWLGITNESDATVPVILTGLVDDIYGDLTLQDNPAITNGTCSLGETIAPGETYRCSFEATVEGAVGEVVTDTVTATGVDERLREVMAAGEASVTLVIKPPDTGVELPGPLVGGALAVAGVGLLLGGVVLRVRMKDE